MSQRVWGSLVLATAYAVLGCLECVAQTTGDVLRGVEEAWRPRMAYRQAVRTYLPPEGTADVRGLSEADLASVARTGRQLESREILAHPTGGFLLDETHETVRKARGRQQFSLYHADTYARITANGKPSADLWRRETGGVFGTPANYAPSAWPLEMRRMLTADPAARIDHGSPGTTRVVFPSLRAALEIGPDGRILRIEDDVGARGVQHRTLIGRIVTTCTSRPLPRYMITTRARGDVVEFQAITVFEDPAPDPSLPMSALQWETYKATAEDRVTGEILGPGGVILRQASEVRESTRPPTPPRSSAVRLDQEKLRAARDDESVLLLPSETPWYRRTMFIIGAGFLVAAGAWVLRRRIAHG